MELAVLYINSHHRDGFYVKEANESAKVFKVMLPSAKFYLYTDYENDEAVGNFDEVRKAKFYVPDFLKDRVHLNGQMLVKHQAMLDMNEAAVLYLGADTYALKDGVKSMTKLLEHFDIAVAHAPVRINTEHGNSSIDDIPACYPEFNCDIILYHNTEKVREFLRKWQQAYLNDKFSHPHDQGTFRYLLYKSDLRVATLPPEWNYRGDEVRDDTVILQNRFLLSRYLGEKKDGHLMRLKQFFCAR